MPKGFGHNRKVKRIPLGTSGKSSAPEGVKIPDAGEGSEERTEPMNMMSTIEAAASGANVELVTDKSRWEALLASYRAARAAEDDYAERVWEPAWEAREPGTNKVEDSIDAELERLGDLRSAAEDLLMECPSPDASAFATKYLVAHAGGRDIDAWDAMLEAEARQFADLASAVSPDM